LQGVKARGFKIVGYSFIDFFTDPVLRAPTIGSILMCVTSSIVGAVVLLRKRSLIGESLSHASYPGIALGVIIGSFFFSPYSSSFSAAVLFFAALSSLAGIYIVDLLEKKFRVTDDAALCFVLSIFFGLGVLISSRIQTTHALWYRQVQSFLYGQAATMHDEHIYIYLALLCVTAIAIIVFFREIKVFLFDRSFAKSIGMNLKVVETTLLILTVMAVVVGIRSVGVVMMAGMLVAPALAARFLTDNFKKLFLVSSGIGALSGFLGNYFSLYLPSIFSMSNVSLPTGPMILLSASFFCFLALIFSPKKGLIGRLFRVYRFRRSCQLDNFLKMLWKESQLAAKKGGAVDIRFFSRLPKGNPRATH
jgi:manganese/zinc/iron transport system permease protein